MKTKQRTLIFLFLLFFYVATAQTVQIVTRDGTIYKSATIEKADPDGLTISYTIAGGGLGMAKLKFANLPNDLQKEYGYNPTNAAAFEAGQRVAVGKWRTQLIAAQDESRAKWHAAKLAEEIDAATKSGTGFFITDDGFLLTCYHVIRDTTHVTISTRDELYSAEVVRTDPDNDVALLKVQGEFHSLPFISSTNAKLGDAIFTIGFPVISLQGVEPKLTMGEINSLTGLQDDPGAFQVSAAVQPGNSGGPLVDQFGNIIGIVSSRISDQAAVEASGMMPQNVNYAMKSSKARALLAAEPGLSAELKKPYPPEERKFADIVQETEDAVVLVLAY